MYFYFIMFTNGVSAYHVAIFRVIIFENKNTIKIEVYLNH
jgi:hypothetical protein